jgi:hypothetical protein
MSSRSPSGYKIKIIDFKLDENKKKHLKAPNLKMVACFKIAASIGLTRFQDRNNSRTLPVHQTLPGIQTVVI